MYDVKEGCPRYIIIDQCYWIKANGNWILTQIDENFEFRTTNDSIVIKNKITHYIYIHNPKDIL